MKFFSVHKIKNIIFDLGGVIIDIDYQATTKAFEKLGIDDFNTRYSQLNQTALFDDFEKGIISSQHFINKLMDIVPKGVTPNQIVSAWNAMLGKIPAQKIQLLNHVRSTHRIFMLSNTNALHLPVVNKFWRDITPLEMRDLFEQVYLSFEIGMRKPDKEIFEWVCKENNLNPENTLFIDDSPQHIEGAKSAGLKTHFYENEQEFYALFS